MDRLRRHFSSVQFSHSVMSNSETPWIAAHQASLSSTKSRSSLKLMSAAAKSLQSCLTLCDLIDGSPPGSSLPGIFQARTPEWVAISFSNALKWKVKVKSLSHVRLLVTPWTVAHQAPPSMGFSRQEYSRCGEISQTEKEKHCMP